MDERKILEWVLNRVGSCGLDSNGSGVEKFNALESYFFDG
jgi:hypothetical protein